MGIDYDPTRIIAGVDTGKIRMARRYVRAMRGTPGIDYASEVQTLLELAEALEEGGQAEEAARPRPRAGCSHLPPAFLTSQAEVPNEPDDGLLSTLADIPDLVQIPVITRGWGIEASCTVGMGTCGAL
jgi:hypothetical protein